MIDLPSMDPCPAHKKGRHDLGAVIPGDDDHDLTFYCLRCGALRRMPASGPVLSPEAPAMERISISESDFRVLSHEARRPRQDADGRYI